MVSVVSSSLASASLPVEWSNSTVVHLYKSGSRCEPLNYRPVSLTSVPCKIMERVVSAHIIEYLVDSSVLSPHQFGFRKGHSTEDQLLLFYGQVSRWVDRGDSVDVVFLDFSKAFDVVSHSVSLGML